MDRRRSHRLALRRRSRQLSPHGAVAPEPDLPRLLRLRERDKAGPRQTEKRFVPRKLRIARAEAKSRAITDILAKIDAALALPDCFSAIRSRPRNSQGANRRRGRAALAEDEWLAASTELDEASPPSVGELR